MFHNGVDSLSVKDNQSAFQFAILFCFQHT
jgi:hypothetical protein